MLRLRDIHAAYGDVTVLHGIDLAVQTGSVVALVGPNGAGKSTLCAVAAGALLPTIGTVEFHGRDVTREPAHLRTRDGLLLVPEGRGIFPGLSVEDNLSLVLPERSQRDQVFDRHPVLADRRNLLAGVLSGGEQQILALAPLLVMRPPLVIADEPSLGLAPRIVEQVFALFEELRDGGLSLLLVEEKITEVLTIADTVVLMSDGRLAWTGSRSEVDPERLAASYLGLDGIDGMDREVVST